MANDEHVAILKQGVDAWNAWRRANLGTRPDLSGADLTDATQSVGLRLLKSLNLQNL